MPQVACGRPEGEAKENELLPAPIPKISPFAGPKAVA